MTSTLTSRPPRVSMGGGAGAVTRIRSSPRQWPSTRALHSQHHCLTSSTATSPVIGVRAEQLGEDGRGVGGQADQRVCVGEGRTALPDILTAMNALLHNTRQYSEAPDRPPTAVVQLDPQASVLNHPEFSGPSLQTYV